jgi:DNA (cytosine-5)-methyltransferase 1
MAIKDVWIKGIGKSKGRPRFYLDGLQAIRAGFSPGEKFEVEVDGQKVIIHKCEDGSRTVVAKNVKRKGETSVTPVIDINSKELLAIFEGMDAIRVVVSNDRVYLLPLASQARKVERLDRLKNKLINGQPLAAGSMAHGGGVLAHAIHTGLSDAGVECDLKFANELRDDLLLQAIEHNDVWSENTASLAVPMQELAQDEWLLGRLPKLELLELGLPCSGASLAGHTKNGLTKMEDHEEVGHLVHSALVVISKTNPAVVLLENVPRYADTASSQILRHQFRDMGYKTHEAILDGADFGCIEGRVRWCMVAVTSGIEFNFEDLRPHARIVRTVQEAIDPTIELNDERWREVTYLKEKEIRNKEAGDSFKMQFVVPESTKVPTIRKGYFKGGSCDVRLRHPTDDRLSRLFTASEHAKIKGVPPELIEGLAQTNAHQLLGQGIVYEPFRAAGQRIGEHLLAFIDSDEMHESEQSSAHARRERITG